MCDEGCARRGGDAWWRVTASRHWCHGGVRVQRGLRGAAVMWFGRRRAVRARALHGRCAHAARRVSDRARLGGASCASAEPIASLGDAKAVYTPRSSDFAADFAALQQGLYTGAVHARAAREDCETRRSHFNYVRAEVLSAACQTVRIKLPCSVATFIRKGKLLRVPKEAYLKSHPRNTLPVTAASTEQSAAEQTQCGHTQREFRRRTAAASYDERSRCCPGPTFII